MKELSDSKDGDTRVRVLLIARRLFGQRGFRGATVRAITSAADVNLGAITYHFGTKQRLYEVVLEQCLEPVAVSVEAAAARPDAPMERIEAVLRTLFLHLRKNPDVPQFLLQEVAAGDEPSAPVRRTLERVLGALGSLIEEGKREGSLHAGDARLTAVSILAQPVHLVLLSRLFGREGDADATPLNDTDLVEQHAVDFVRTALQSSAEVVEP